MAEPRLLYPVVFTLPMPVAGFDSACGRQSTPVKPLTVQPEGYESAFILSPYIARPPGINPKVNFQDLPLFGCFVWEVWVCKR
jgi:hypothetical protein